MLAKGPLIGAGEIDLMQPDSNLAEGSFQAAKARMVERFECSYISSLLSSCGGNISQAARMARKNRRAFWELIRKHNIDVQRFKEN